MLLILMLGASLVGLFYGWSEWRGQVYQAQIPSWRRTTASVGLLAVTLQAALFIGHHPALLRVSAFVEVFLVLVAVPCVFSWKGRARWWLLASSTFLCLEGFFTIFAIFAY